MVSISRVTKNGRGWISSVLQPTWLSWTAIDPLAGITWLSKAPSQQTCKPGTSHNVLSMHVVLQSQLLPGQSPLRLSGVNAVNLKGRKRFYSIMDWESVLLTIHRTPLFQTRQFSEQPRSSRDSSDRHRIITWLPRAGRNITDTPPAAALAERRGNGKRVVLSVTDKFQLRWFLSVLSIEEEPARF